MNVAMACAGLAAVAALVLEYGFRKPPLPAGLLHAVDFAVVGLFVADRILRLALARPRLRYLREYWVDYVLILLAAAAVIIAWRFYGEILGVGALYVLITQMYLLATIVFQAVGLNLRFAGSGIPPSWLLIGSFGVLCLAGSGLLMLPRATPADLPGLSYLDALFTSTSATCVTGLVTKRTGLDFTFFGQAVILGLIQLGGLGIMLFGTVLGMLVGKRLTVRTSTVMGEMLGTDGRGNIRRLAGFVVLTTLSAEVLGAVLLYPMFSHVPGADGRMMPAGQAAWYSVFHSVSAFCNAGFSLYTDNMMAGVAGQWARPLREHLAILGVIGPLIVLGGIGFPVLQDLGQYGWTWLRRLLYRPTGLEEKQYRPRPRRPKLSVHTRLVLISTAILLVLGTVGLLAVEPWSGTGSDHEGWHPDSEIHGGWQYLSFARRLRAAAFHSISARTAGFNTIDMAHLSDSGKLWLCGLMVVGGSPGGTAGGIKTVTLAVLLAAGWSILRRRQEVELFRRSLNPTLIGRAWTIAMLYLALVGVTTLLLSISMRGIPFIDVLFESCSACGTVGLSTGVTGAGGWTFTRLVTIGAMFLGRLGPITLLLALTSGLPRARYSYPREDVLLG